MGANEFTEGPHTIGCIISQGIVCWRWLQSDGAIFNRWAINHSNLSILEGLATLIGSHLTREPTAGPVLTKWWHWELILATNFGSLCPKVTNYGSQNFGYQIWFCTRLFISLIFLHVLSYRFLKLSDFPETIFLWVLLLKTFLYLSYVLSHFRVSARLLWFQVPLLWNLKILSLLT